MKNQPINTAMAITLLATAPASAFELHKQLTLDGLVEIEASAFRPAEGDDSSELRVATVELGVTAQVNPWVAATVSLLYEQNETDLEIDIAQITIANSEQSPWSFTAGQFYLPFGQFETQLVSDPLTLELGETRTPALHIGFSQHDWTGGVFVFNGDHAADDSDDTANLDRWGAHVGMTHEAGDDAAVGWSWQAGYMSDLGGSDTLEDVVTTSDNVAGWAVSAGVQFSGVHVNGEYLAATDEFAPADVGYRERGAQPAAWQLECGYQFNLLGKEQTATVGYQGTQEALALELPQRRWLVGWSTAVLPQTSVAVEWSQDRDYRRSDGGSGETSNSVVAQLAVEF